MALGVDAWWPDDGDELPIEARLARHLCYYEGPLQARPDARPWSLNRNGYAGASRYGGWIWSGDRQFALGHAGRARAGGPQQFVELDAVLGNGHGRICSHARIDGRTLRALVRVCRVQSAVPFARPDLASAPAVGMEHRRNGADRNARRGRPRRNCTTSKSNRSAANTWNCATACCPTITR